MRAAATLLCLLSTSCAFQSQLQRVAVDQNQMVANNANQLVLVNILRARDREPLHFTSINKLFGDASIEGTAGAGLTIGDTDTGSFDAARALTGREVTDSFELGGPNVGLTMGGKSTIDVGVFDSQEFYQGITSSLSPGIVAHYLHQGWSDELFTYLFVSQIEFVVSDKAAKDPVLQAKYPHGLPPAYREGNVLGTLVNDPATEILGNQFGAFVNCFRLTHYPKTGKDQPLVPLSAVKDLSLADLALLDGDKFEVDAVDPIKPGERWIRRKGKGGDALGLRKVSPVVWPGEDARCVAGTADAAADPAAAKLQSTYSANRFTLDPGPSGPIPVALQPNEHQGLIASGMFVHGGDKVPVNVQVVLRSIDGVIYFLGEYLRVSLADRRADPARRYQLFIGNETYVPIIAVDDTRPGRIFTSARFHGRRYYVRGNANGVLDTEGGRSSQVFALVEQLINLQKTAKESPSTQTVRVVQ